MMLHTPIRLFTRPLIALGLAASIALTPVAAVPAKAGDDEMAAFLAALTAMIVIGTVLDDGRYHERGRGRHGVWYWNKALPEHCLKSYRTRDGHRAYFTKRCLRHNYRGWRSLPAHCELTVRLRDDYRHGRNRITVYKPRCLRRAGYFIARTHSEPDWPFSGP
jgi:hypothetical protein